jgi:saccharopine dehydrogenase-like NADP-dependent oxidoreductase
MDSHEHSIAETLALAPGAQGMHGRFNDTAAVDKALAGQWAVVSCAPFFCNPMIAEHAKAAGVHYLDLTEDVAVTKKVMELAKGAKTAFIPQCGLAPGFITIAANHVIQGMGAMHEVKMRVGALPEFPSNALKYNLTWSTDGLINEYIQPCEAVVDGHVTVVPALEGLEHMMIDGIEFEAFNTSGGLGTFASTLEGRVKHLSYKTMRYPGHFERMRFLLDDLHLRHDRETLARVLKNALPPTAEDFVYVHAHVEGWRHGELASEQFVRVYSEKPVAGQIWRAISWTTAAGICAVVEMVRAGTLARRGFIRQEDIPFGPFLATESGGLYHEA